MITQSGKFIPDPLNIRECDIDFDDIMSALSLINRFGGHTGSPYSVLEHLCHCYDKAKLLTSDKDVLTWVLLHDVAEAYIGDIIRPIKRRFPEVLAAERHILETFRKKYGLNPEIFGNESHPILVEIDNRMCSTEMVNLFESDKVNIPEIEPYLTKYPPYSGEFLQDRWYCDYPSYVRHEFRNRLNELRILSKLLT